MFPGLNVEFGFSLYGGISPTWLTNSLVQTGIQIARLWIADDSKMDSYSNATTVPSRINSGDLTSGGTFKFQVSRIGSRSWFSSPNAALRFFSTNAVSFKSSWHVAIPTVPFTSYGALLRGSGVIFTESNSGSSLLRTPSTSRLSYIDGIQTNTVTSTSRIFECSGTTAFTNSFNIGGMFDGAFPWVGYHALHMLLTEPPTTQQRSDVVNIINQYYNIS